MIKIEADSKKDHGNGFISCEVDGNIKDITIEMMEGISAVYQIMSEQDVGEGVLRYFRRKIIMAVCNPDSTIWDLRNKTDFGRRARDEPNTCQGDREKD